MPRFGPPARLRPYFGYRNAARLVIDARALRLPDGHDHPDRWQRPTTFARMRTLWSHFASREVSGIAVTIAARSAAGSPLHAIATTDSEGFVRFELDLGGDWPLPEHTCWETVTLRWTARDGPQEAAGYVLAPGKSQRLGVISDIDDTILETGAHDLVRNWRRVLAQMPGERQPVLGVAALYKRLGGADTGAGTGAGTGTAIQAAARPFFYISSSPWNLFDYLHAFKQAHGLPQGPMLLRDWGLNRATLGRTGHGTHKSAAVGMLADFYHDIRFALIGDSTQADAIAYADAVMAHPGRIAGVFIRTAPGAPVDAEEQAAFERIVAAGVPLWLGERYDVAEDFLAMLGFLAPADTGPPASAPVQEEMP